MPTYDYVKLTSALKAFEDPDTSSQFQGFISAGEYQVEESKLNFPDSDTDYLLISVPSLGDEETWICSRWKQTNYAKIFKKSTDSAPGIDFTSHDEAINESYLTDLLPDFYNFNYDLDQARYPFELSGFRTPVAPPFQNNCCTFVEALLVKAWENAMNNFRWNMDNHRQMMIYSADDYFSPVTCLVNNNMALPVDNHDQSPHAWTVVQGWRKQWTSGHTFIIVKHDPETDRVLTLESNSSYNLNGVGYRMIGNLGEFNRPPDNWREIDGLWTWERMKSVYRFRNQCILKVKNVRFISL